MDLVKTRPLAPGHELRLYVEPGRKKDRSSEARCSCTDRTIVYGSASRAGAQAVLDAAARSHGSELTFGDYRLSRLLETLELELRHLDVDEILELYGRSSDIPEKTFSGNVTPRTRRTPRQRIAS